MTYSLAQIVSILRRCAAAFIQCRYGNTTDVAWSFREAKNFLVILSSCGYPNLELCCGGTPGDGLRLSDEEDEDEVGGTGEVRDEGKGNKPYSNTSSLTRNMVTLVCGVTRATK